MQIFEFACTAKASCRCVGLRQVDRILICILQFFVLNIASGCLSSEKSTILSLLRFFDTYDEKKTDDFANEHE